MRSEVIRFIGDRATGVPGEYRYSVTGSTNLYSSCYALMTLHYLDALPISSDFRFAWAEYIQQWQDPYTGYFLGPELVEPLPTNAKHDLTHLKLHLVTTVLPCLAILDSKPRYQLKFAMDFLDPNVLSNWLSHRDWRDAWLEGNNLIFVIQLLIYLRDVEKIPESAKRIEEFFAWLDSEIDPSTGLWGTNGHCNHFVAMCGGYHQLLAYYWEQRPNPYPQKLIDTTLALQHPDGGFHPGGGGGACEDVDAVDILVNMYKLHKYRRPEIRYALRKVLRSITIKQMPDGGFVYRLNESFRHMGMLATETDPNNSNMFATWFRVHALALIAEILNNKIKSEFNWKFNTTLSMGWHRQSSATDVSIGFIDRLSEYKSLGIKGLIKEMLKPEGVILLKNVFQKK